MDRAAWWAAVHGVTKSQTRLKRLSSSSSRETKQQQQGLLHNKKAKLGSVGAHVGLQSEVMAEEI